MRLIVQRIMYIFLIVSLIITNIFTISVSANDNKLYYDSERHQQIIEILNKLGQCRAKKQLDQYSNSINSTYVNSKEEELETNLKALGVKSLTAEEVNKIFQQKDATPNVVTPPSTNNVKWYSETYLVIYQGTEYVAQNLYAQGYNSPSGLINGQDGAVLYSNKQVLVSNVVNLILMYVQKAIGLIPYVAWTPYELLFTNNNNVTNNSHIITYRSVQTVCFAFINLKGQNDAYQKLSYTSNKIDVAVSHTLAGVNNGVPYSKSSGQYVYTDYATIYNNVNEAIACYRSNLHGSSFISKYVFYNEDKTRSITQSLVRFDYPAEIY